MVTDVTNFVKTLEGSPAFQTAVAEVLPHVPPSVLAEAYSDPEALLEQVAADGEVPAWVSAIPTSVIASLETLAAKPIKAAEDLEDYLEQLSDEPEVSSALDILQTAVPTSIQDALESSPAAFLENLVTETSVPSWVTNIPTPVQSEIEEVVNTGLSIVAADLEGNAPAGVALPTGASGYLLKSGYATGTGYSGASTNGTVATGTPAASPKPFQGAAAPAKPVAGVMAVILAAAGWWVNN